MTNNDVLRRLRFAFNFSDDQVIDLFQKGGVETDRATISNWLKKDEHEDFQYINDFELASFLNGFIVLKRGQKDGQTPIAEEKINNNLILRKLKIALNYKDEDIVELLKTMDFEMSKSEINAFFRKSNHDKYRHCKDQMLRVFLQGLTKRFAK